MQDQLHSFHIPVMGIGHSVDTPLRVAPFGVSSVISLVDDTLLEELREYYSQQNNLPYSSLAEPINGGRAQRVKAYLDMVHHLVMEKVRAIKNQPFFQGTDKDLFFRLLPDQSKLKADYLKMKDLAPGPERDALADHLTDKIEPGSIDVNIMVKLDRAERHSDGQAVGDEFTDAQTALRGFAESVLDSSVVFSAGMNQRLFSYLPKFKDFYRNEAGRLKKKITLKVSDFRSALVQTKLLAKRGLEVSEYRVESGLNCGGHTFPARGQLLPSILHEFREKWTALVGAARESVRAYYKKQGWSYPEPNPPDPLLTVQGGIGNRGEANRLHETFGVDRTGWGSPFLLVPEVTNVDDASRELLRQATESDLYMSDISPLGVPFNTVRGTGSDVWTELQRQAGRPGSPCMKGFVSANTEFSSHPICVASRQYQSFKLADIERSEASDLEKNEQREKVLEKTCLCHHLGNGVRIKLGLATQISAPPAVCPGPNIAWFDRFYTFEEMVDHIYGRGESLVPKNRPHMFAAELVMNVNYYEKLLAANHKTRTEVAALEEFKENLEKGIEACLLIAKTPARAGENLESLELIAKQQRARLTDITSSAKVVGF